MNGPKNRRHGFSYERRRLLEAIREGGYGLRSYASGGVVDIIYVDRNGTANLEQCKFSSVGNPRIATDELGNLCKFARRWQGLPCNVSLVLKASRKEPEIYKLNVPGIPENPTLAEIRRLLG